MPRKVVYGRSDTKYNMENTGDPNELLGEGPRKGEVSPRDSECDNQDENEENDGVCIQRKVIPCIVNPSTTEAFICAVALEREARDGDETKESEDQLGDMSVTLRFSEGMGQEVREFQPKDRCISACPA